MCAGENWKERKIAGRLVSLGAGKEMDEACAGGEKTRGGGEAMRAALLMTLNVVSFSREERAV